MARGFAPNPSTGSAALRYGSHDEQSFYVEIRHDDATNESVALVAPMSIIVSCLSRSPDCERSQKRKPMPRDTKDLAR